MDRTKALAVALACVFASWYLWPMIFDWGVGIEFPFLGWIGIKPFEFLEQYFALFVGFIGVLVMWLMMKKRGTT